jgi:hypothetical protein
MIYFVTEYYIKENTPITKNVDVTDVMPWLKTVSDQRIQPILGTYFYEDILTKYNAQTLSADEETLVTYIQPIVAWFGASASAFGLSYQIKNKGIQQQFGDFSQNVTFSEVTFTMEHLEQIGWFYIRRLEYYLTENKALFSNFTSELNKDSDLKPIIEKCNNDNDYNNTMIVFD